MNRFIVFECCCFLCSDREFKIKRSKEKLRDILGQKSHFKKMDPNFYLFNIMTGSQVLTYIT